jgi:hypothetical protein
MRSIPWVLPLAAAAMPACESAPPSAPAAGVSLQLLIREASSHTSLDSGMVRIRGPANHDLVLYPGGQARVEVPEGTYSVALEGFAGDRVRMYGETPNVTVRAGADTHVVLPLADFVPVMMRPSPARVGEAVVIEWRPIDAAAGYLLELSEDFASGVDSLVTALAPLWQGRFMHPRRLFARVHALSPYGSAGVASSEETLEIGVPLRVRITTTSDWTVVLLIGGAQWGAPTVVSTSDGVSRFTFDGEAEGVSLLQPIDRAVEGSSVEGVIDVLADADCQTDAVRVRIERGHLGSTRVELLRDLGGDWTVAAVLTWSGVDTEDDRNASEFDVTCDLLVSEPGSR